MLQEAAKKEVLKQLRREILAAEGLQRPTYESTIDLGLSALEEAFPDKVFPTGCIHEFISPDTETAAATTGFIAALLGHLSLHKGPCIWVSSDQRLFAPALTAFGLQPDQVIFIQPERDKDLLWAAEQALRCEALAAVIVDMKELDLTASRRLQLAVEQSRITGLLHRHHPARISNTASVARWQVQPLSSNSNGLPGVGYPCWQVELQKVRNGKPGSWIVEWAEGRLQILQRAIPAGKQYTRYQKVG